MGRPEARIVTWNVHNSTPPEIAFEHLYALAGPVDVVCLQELLLRRGSEAGEVLGLGRQVLGMEGVISDTHICRGPPMLSPPSKETLATLSSTAIIWSHAELLSSGDLTLLPSKQSAKRKFLATTVLPNGWDIPITVGNVHLSLPWGPFGGINKKQQADERDKLIEEILPHPDNRENFVLAGDFNAEPDSKLIKAIGKYLEFVSGAPAYGTQEARKWGRSVLNTVDYIFATPDLEGELSMLNPGPSDHSPLLATVWRK